MDSRLLHALLYFLPGNATQSPDNPLQPDRLPDISGVELDYPVYQDAPAAAAKYLAMVVFVSALVAPILAWTAHWVSIPFLYGGLNSAVLIAAGGLMVLGIFGRWWPLGAFALALIALPVLALLVREVPFVLAALLLAGAGQLLLTDALATNYVYFKTAAPLPRQQSQQIRRLWRWRYVNLLAPLRGSEFFGLGMLVPLAAAWWVIHSIGVTPEGWPFAQVAVLFFALVALGILWCVAMELVAACLFGRWPYSPWACVGALFRALVVWCTYNRRYARGAGIHRSPAGNCATRRHLLIGLIAAWGCVWAGLQWQAPKHPLAQLVEDLQTQQSLLDTFIPRRSTNVPQTGSRESMVHSTSPQGGGPIRGVDLSKHPLADSEFIEPGARQPPPPSGPPRSDPRLDPRSSEPPWADLSSREKFPARADQKPPHMADYEWEFATRLPPAERAQYLAERLQLHLAKEQQVEAARQRAAATQSPKNLLVGFFRRLTIIFLNVVIPSLGTLAVSGALLLASTARSLAGIEACLGHEPVERVFTSDHWENLVARVRDSDDETEAQSVFLGVNARDDTPVLVPRDVFGEHAHVLGDSGSGKTSLGLAPLITQLVRYGDCSVVVVDLKADDQFLLETLRIEGQSLDTRLRQATPKHPGYPVRWFTTVLGRSSFAFNTLTQRVMTQLDPDQRTDILTAALGLQYGNDYGRKYFGDSNYDLLNYALRENPHLQSMAELEQVLLGADRFPLPAETKKAAGHVRSAIRRLARCQALNVCPNSHTPASVRAQAIELDDLFSQPQALYVALPPSAGISSTAEIARIFLYSLLASAQTHCGPRQRVILVIDEFQRLVSKNVELFLQQARSMNIGCILANQSLADLESIDTNLLPAVRTNTRFRQVFGAGYRTDVEDLLDTSGETVYATRNWNYAVGLFQPELRSVAVNETRGTRLSINDILLATDAPGRNIACVRRGAGYAQFGGMPFLMDSVYHVSKPVYQDRATTPWPAADERMLVAAMPNPQSQPSLPGPRILGESGGPPVPAPETPPAEHLPSPQQSAEAIDEPAATNQPLEPGEGDAEGILDDITQIAFEQQMAEREALRRKLQEQRRKAAARREERR